MTESPRAVAEGRIGSRPRAVRPLPGRGEVKRYVCTSAQNNTYVHEAVWLNVLAMARHYDAELLVGTYTYNKSAYGVKAVKRGSAVDHSHDSWYDPQVVEHLCDESVQLAPGLVWAGELNILPTDMNPLGRMEAYNGRESNVVPHAKFAMASVCSLGHEATKLNFTTGTVTQRNYLQKKIGLLSEQYHGYGAILIEVCDDGDWFVRQLQATEDGVIRDFDLKADGGEVTGGHPISAITWGDVHVRVIDPTTKQLAWGPGGMLEELRPHYQLMHDVIDFRSRNHHDAKDPLLGFEKWREGQEGVDDEAAEVAAFLEGACREWCQTVIVPSNHHEAMMRWLREAEWRTDPANAVFYHEAWLALLRGEASDVFEWSVLRHLGSESLEKLSIRFLKDDESFVIAGTELGQHGHLGLNGARGNHRAFTKLGRPASTGHEHSAGIHLWNWVAGTSSHMRLGYNRGPSSWSSSHIVQYPEGTRTMVTFWNGRWRA